MQVNINEEFQNLLGMYFVFVPSDAGIDRARHAPFPAFHTFRIPGYSGKEPVRICHLADDVFPLLKVGDPIKRWRWCTCHSKRNVTQRKSGGIVARYTMIAPDRRISTECFLPSKIACICSTPPGDKSGGEFADGGSHSDTHVKRVRKTKEREDKKMPLNKEQSRKREKGKGRKWLFNLSWLQ